MSSPRRSRRRVLASLATITAAGAIAVGSGATFSSSSANAANIYKTGTLTQANSKDNVAIFSAENLKPGDTVVGTVTITNSGSLPAKFTLSQVSATNGFVNAANLTLTVVDTTTSTTVWTGTFGQLTPIALGEWAAGQAATFEFRTQLALSAGNEEQGKEAVAEFRWDSVQTDPVTIDQ